MYIKNYKNILPAFYMSYVNNMSYSNKMSYVG